MTLPLNSRLSALYDTNGTQKDFSFGFRVFFDPDNGGYGLEVRRQTADGYEVIPKSDYLVLPVEDNSAGIVRFSVAPSAGQQIYIAGKTPTIQQLVLTNFGRYSAESIETQFDFITAIIQEWLSALGEETRQRIAADDILTQYVVQRIDAFVQQVNQNFDDKSQEIDDYIATIMPSFTQTLRDEIEAFAVAGMQDAIDQTLAESKAEIDDAVARANAAALAAAITGKVYDTPEAGVDPVTGVQNGAYYNVRSPDDDSYLVEYQNIGGVPTPSGKVYPSGAALTAVKEAIIDPVTGLASASKVFDENGNNQQDINNKTVFLSDYINSATADNQSLQEFLSLDAKNKIVDVNPILITDTVYISDNIDFNGAEILAFTDFNAIKKSMLSLAANAKASNLVVNGNNKNVRGISLQNSYAELDGVLVKNTKYLGIEGLGEVEKFGLKLNKIKLDNVCTTGMAGDLGYGGIAVENSVGGWYDHIDMNGIGAKGFRLRNSRNNTGYNHTYHDVRDDQAAFYLASGEGNNFFDITITGTRNPFKFSRGEKNSHVFGLKVDNSHITDATYSVALLLQGTTGCTVNNFNIKKGNGYGIRVEPHPADSDPLAEQPCIDNTLTGGALDSVGTGQMLYLTRSSGLLESKGNEFNNITLNGNDVATEGLRLQNFEDAVFNNLNISGVNGYDAVIAGSAAKFNGGSFVSAPATQRKISIVGGDRCNIEFNTTKIKGSTTADRYLSSDVTAAGGRVAFVGCTDIDVTAATDGLYFAGASTLDFVSSIVKGSRVTIGNNIIGGSYKNNTTTVAPSIFATTMDISGLSASKSFDPPSIASGASTTTTIPLVGVTFGDVVQASFTAYHADIEISAAVSAANTVTVKMKNTGGSPVDLASGTLKVKLI